MRGFPGAGLDEANRRRVLQPRPGWRRKEWEPIPVLGYVRKATGDDAELQLQLKSFLRWFMAAVAATTADAVQFVMLFRLDQRPGEVEYSLMCPYDAPLRLMREARGVGTRELLHGAADMGINFRFGLLADTRVPIVVSCDTAAENFAFDNVNQLNDPDQFLSPQQCRTTSGFLNFFGAHEIRAAKMVMVPNVEELLDQGLGEWLRWFLCIMETGVVLDGARLLVRREAPESWVYDYDGS